MSTEQPKAAGFRPADLQGDFFDHSEDQIRVADTLLDRVSRGEGHPTEALAEIRRIAHSLKGRGTMFEVPSVSLVAARLEDFMAALTSLGTDDAKALRRYFDLLDEIVDARRDMADTELSPRLLRLPRRSAAGPTSGR